MTRQDRRASRYEKNFCDICFANYLAPTTHAVLCYKDRRR